MLERFIFVCAIIATEIMNPQNIIHHFFHFQSFSDCDTAADAIDCFVDTQHLRDPFLEHRTVISPSDNISF